MACNVCRVCAGKSGANICNPNIECVYGGPYTYTAITDLDLPSHLKRVYPHANAGTWDALRDWQSVMHDAGVRQVPYSAV